MLAPDHSIERTFFLEAALLIYNYFKHIAPDHPKEQESSESTMISTNQNKVHSSSDSSESPEEEQDF